MRKKCYLLVLCIFIMMLMAVSSVKAQGRLKFVVPQEIKDRYLINIDPEQTLVALPAIPVQDCMITMYIVPFMTKEHARLYDSNDRSKMKEEWVQAEAFMCGCPSHTVSDKLLCFRVRINNEWKVVFHQEHKIKKKKQTPLPPNFS